MISRREDKLVMEGVSEEMRGQTKEQGDKQQDKGTRKKRGNKEIDK